MLSKGKSYKYPYLLSNKVSLWKSESVLSPVLQLISGSEGDNSGITVPALAKAHINTDIVHPADKTNTHTKQNIQTVIIYPLHELIDCRLKCLPGMK